MARFTVEHGTAKAVAKRMLKLAWDASQVVGNGFLQDRGPGMTESQVWDHTHGEVTGQVNADYLFGRMMKLYFAYGDDFIDIPDRQWRSDYQSFCGVYPDGPGLVAAAIESLGMTPVAAAA